MLESADAALVIGDYALFAEPARLGLEKIDLAEEWIGMTGLPFVFAFWAGRPGAVTAATVASLQAARDRGLADTETVAARYFPGDAAKIQRGAQYLRENLKYDFGEPERAGLRRFYKLAHALELVPAVRVPDFY